MLSLLRALVLMDYDISAIYSAWLATGDRTPLLVLCDLLDERYPEFGDLGPQLRSAIDRSSLPPADTGGED